MGLKKRTYPENRAPAIVKLLAQTWPQAACELDFADPFQLLVATILSAQSTDRRVNQVTPALFRRFPTAAALAAADQGDLEQLIHSTGFFRNKARALVSAARKIVTDHGGRVPRDMDSLTSLPGVARKTANVVLGSAFGIASGVVVDTHVKRVAARLGLTAHSDPVKIERDLMLIAPRNAWVDLGHQLIWHGRRTCHARTPQCESCPLAPLCPSAEAG